MSRSELVIAGTHSGVGKTTVTCGLMAALCQRSLQVQPFKVGPDYIDPAFHSQLCGRPSINLDTWMLTPNQVTNTYRQYTRQADVAIIEGVMGLFDGSNDADNSGSTAHLATTLGLPVVLVVDVSRMATSAAAIVNGYATLQPQLRVGAVIANRVGSPSHYRMVKRAIERYTKIPVVGGIPVDAELTIPERHLGLLPASEFAPLEKWTLSVATLIQDHVDMDALLDLTQSDSFVEGRPVTPPIPRPRALLRIGLAKDDAFNFYYEENLALLRSCGAHICEFSPLHDSTLPDDVAALYFGGGFPEMFAHRLAENASLLASIKDAYQRGMPILAECGGLVYLSNALHMEGHRHQLVGVIQGEVTMEKKLVSMGYRQVTMAQDTILGSAGTAIRGHEFHYSRISLHREQQTPAFSVENAAGSPLGKEGYVSKNLLASYIHFHFGSNPQAAQNFVTAAHQFALSRRTNP